jgi:predicted RNA binding protein YcfA (HicA-like mRNA interferase family)
MGFTMTTVEIIAFLTSKGYRKEVGRGRHSVKMIMGTVRIPIPVHSGDVPVGTIKKILAQAGYSISDVMGWRH